MTDREVFASYALSFVGTNYRWGGDDPSGWDCSGLCIELLTAGGVWSNGEDATAQGLFNHFEIRGHRGFFDLGSLAFYGKSTSAITHVAFGVSPRLVVEAGGGGRNTLTPEDANRQNAFVRLRPLTHRADLVATIGPLYKFLEA